MTRRVALWLPKDQTSGRTSVLSHLILTPPATALGHDVLLHDADSGSSSMEERALAGMLPRGAFLQLLQLCRLASVPTYLLANTCAAVQAHAPAHRQHNSALAVSLAAGGTCLLVQALPGMATSAPQALRVAGTLSRPGARVAALAPVPSYLLLYEQEGLLLLRVSAPRHSLATTVPLAPSLALS